MAHYRNLRYRLHPGSRDKHQALLGTAGACRFTWKPFSSGFCGMSTPAYERCNPRFFSTAKRFTKLRKAAPWLKEYSAISVRAVLKDLQDTYTRFYEGEGRLAQF